MNSKYKLLFIIIFAIIISGCSSDNIHLKMEDFVDFTNMPRAFEESVYDEGLSSGVYPERIYYYIFNAFVGSSSGLNESCIYNKETYKCLYMFSIINNRPDLCEQFPESRLYELCSSPGCVDVTIPYKKSCLAYTDAFIDYAAADDKKEFCKSFSEEYLVNSCFIFSCNSYYGPENIPSFCNNPETICVGNVFEMQNCKTMLS